MSKSQESFGKKEKEKARLKKRQEKEGKKADRKANSNKGKSFEEMLAYVDENGNVTSVPPDPNRRKEINVEDIVISTPSAEPEDILRKGRVTFFNESKGYGFIQDLKSQRPVFVHINQLNAPLRENDLVTFVAARNEKGVYATEVSLTKD